MSGRELRGAIAKLRACAVHDGAAVDRVSDAELLDALRESVEGVIERRGEGVAFVSGFNRMGTDWLVLLHHIEAMRRRQQMRLVSP